MRERIRDIVKDLTAELEAREPAFQRQFTLALFVVVNFCFITLLGAAFFLGPLPWYATLLGFLVQTFIVIIAFTPLHDSAHRSAHLNKLINEMILVGSSFIFVNSTPLFRRLHIAHHAKTNTIYDPDHFTAHPSLAMRWLKSFLLIFNYYRYGFKYFRLVKLFWVDVIASFAIVAFVIGGAIYTGRYDVFIAMWILPAFVGIGILAFLDTAWPHHPGEETKRYRNTKNLYVPMWLQLIMGNQNLHLLHHLYPEVPWYRYPQVWERIEADAVAKGAVVLKYTKRSRAHKLPGWRDLAALVRQAI